MEMIPLTQRMDSIAALLELSSDVWPGFIAENPDEHSERILQEMADFQLLAFDGDVLVATGHTIPIRWFPEDPLPDGCTGTIARGMKEFDQGVSPTALCALSIVIRPSHQGQGLATDMVTAMKNLGRAHGFFHLLAPVRPTLKSQYPLIPMAEYIKWRREDGSAFDPWMRVHEQLGGELVEVANNAMIIEGTVAQWEKWSMLSMKSSGQYVVKGTLGVVEIDVDADSGIYREDNVWYRYQL